MADLRELSVQDLYDQLDADLERVKREEADLRNKRALLDSMVKSLEYAEVAPGFKQLPMTLEETQDRGTERSFDIVLGKTNYEQGFFNVPISSDGLIAGNECQLILPDGLKVEARITRNQNRNGTARIFGSAMLKHWFRENFSKGMEVPAFILDDSTILLGEHSGSRTERNGHSTRPIAHLAEFRPAQ